MKARRAGQIEGEGVGKGKAEDRKMKVRWGGGGRVEERKCREGEG